MPDENPNTTVENAAKALAAIQSTMDGLKGRVDALDADKLNKASLDAEKNAQALQDLQAKFTQAEEDRKASEARYEALEKAMSKQRRGDDAPKTVADWAKAMPSDYSKAANSIIRNDGSQTISEEMTKANLMDVCRMQLPGLDEVALQKAAEITRKALVVGSRPDGGMFAPVERTAMIIRQIFETSPMRQVAGSISTAAQAVEILIDDNEFTATWGHELSVPTDDATPQVGDLTIQAHNLFARAPISENMLEDSTIDIIGWISAKAADKFARTENSAFVNGDGVNKPRGILTMPEASNPDVYERGAVGIVDALTPSAQGVFVADDMFNVQNHVKEPYQAGAIWLLKRRTFFNIATLKDNDGQYLLQFGNALATGLGPVLLGKPIMFADDMPAVAGDATPIAYGDFKRGYTILDRVGMSLLVDPYTADPKVRFRFRKRVGGHVTNFEAYKIFRVPAS